MFRLFSVTEGEEVAFVLKSRCRPCPPVDPCPPNVVQTCHRTPNFPDSYAVGARICETRLTLAEKMCGDRRWKIMPFS
jgi:hypothetical protein